MGVERVMHLPLIQNKHSASTTVIQVDSRARISTILWSFMLLIDSEMWIGRRRWCQMDMLWVHCSVVMSSYQFNRCRRRRLWCSNVGIPFVATPQNIISWPWRATIFSHLLDGASLRCCVLPYRSRVHGWDAGEEGAWEMIEEVTAQKMRRWSAPNQIYPIT